MGNKHNKRKKLQKIGSRKKSVKGLALVESVFGPFGWKTVDAKQEGAIEVNPTGSATEATVVGGTESEVIDMIEMDIEITTDIKTETPDYDTGSELSNVKIEPEDYLESTVEVKNEKLTDEEFTIDTDVLQSHHDNSVKPDVIAKEAIIESYDEPQACHASFINNLFVKEVFVKEELNGEILWKEDTNRSDLEGQSKVSCSTPENAFQVKKELQRYEENKILNCAHCDDLFANLGQLYTHCAAKHSIYLCNICNKREFDSKRGLHAHFRGGHQLHCKACLVEFTSEHGSLKPCKKEHGFCEKCKKWYGSQEELSAHAHSHVSKKHPMFRCSSCGVVWKSYGVLKIHRRNAHSICDQCNLEFPDKVQLAAHEEEIHGIFTCYRCGAHFSNPSDLNLHRITAHSIYFCDTCKLIFKSEDYWTAHIRKAHRSCKVCLVEFNTEFDLLQHCKEEHVLCTECNNWFLSEKLLSEHAKDVHPTFRCSACSIELKSEAALNFHKRSEHIRCVECNLDFPDKVQLTSHQEEIHGILMCSRCGAFFSLSSDLRQHFLAAHSRYLCTLCNQRTFTSEDTLTAHIKISHSFPCKVCLVELPTANDLLLHCQKVHVFCTVCKKWFSSQEKLDEHTSSVHTIFHCSHCDIEYNSNLALKLHKRNEHNVCDRCNLEFLGKKQLASHEQKAHRFFPCALCYARFSHAVDLTRHHITTHLRAY